MSAGQLLTAPASRVLTVLHVVDQSAPWVTDTRGGTSTTGSTVCGLPMLTAENWQLIEQRPGEPLCPRCADPSRPAAAEEALW